jgi:hypothetical protein
MLGLNSTDLTKRGTDQFVAFNELEKKIDAKGSIKMQAQVILLTLSNELEEFSLFYKNAFANNKATDKEKLKAFRYPLVTYLTGTTFRLLSNGLKHLNDQFESKDVDGYDICLASNFFSLVSANFRALTMAGLRLGDLLPDQKEFEDFVKIYDASRTRFSTIEAVKSSLPAQLSATKDFLGVDMQVLIQNVVDDF